VSPLSTPSPQTAQAQAQAFGSFWSEGAHGDGDGQGGGGWTQVIPQELIAAAAEEEAFLANADTQSTTTASSSGVPAPNIPPAPILPRHLDKLILNVRPSAVTGAASVAGVGAAERERSRKSRDKSRRERERERDRETRARASLGMTSSNTATVTVEGGGASDQHLAPPQLTLPIATASGTDLTAAVLNSPPASMPSTPQEPSRLPVAKLDGPGLADDASVLPVPSHVVLHHLSTSAIRNGVLAVANTTRYRKKYITTIYYKPT